jgi:hypothetical protein
MPSAKKDFEAARLVSSLFQVRPSLILTAESWLKQKGPDLPIWPFSVSV